MQLEDHPHSAPLSEDSPVAGLGVSTSKLSFGAWYPLHSDLKPRAADLQGEASRMEVFVPTDEETGSETTWGELGSW